jgi:hypothetical protein
VGLLKEARDEVMKEAEDTRRRLEVLTQFFNKKEAELQKQLGLQSVRCSVTVIYSSLTQFFFNKKEAELQKQLGLQIVRCSVPVIYSSKKIIKNKGGGHEAEAELQKQLGLQSVRCSVTVIYSSKKIIKNKGGGNKAEAEGPHPVLLQQEGARAPETAWPPECQMQY